MRYCSHLRCDILECANRLADLLNEIGIPKGFVLQGLESENRAFYCGIAFMSEKPLCQKSRIEQIA